MVQATLCVLSPPLPQHLCWFIQTISIFMSEAVTIIGKIHSPWSDSPPYYASFFSSLTSTLHLSQCSRSFLNFLCPSLDDLWVTSSFLHSYSTGHTAEMAQGFFSVLLDQRWPESHRGERGVSGWYRWKFLGHEWLRVIRPKFFPRPCHLYSHIAFIQILNLLSLNLFIWRNE